jgi:glycosyltransferase-like protein LARGE
MVVDRRTVPRFDRRFVGFGWNKVAHAMALDAAGCVWGQFCAHRHECARRYDFVVLPSAWSVHVTHAPSADMHDYSTNGAYRHCMYQLKAEYVKQLAHAQRLTRPLPATPTVHEHV